MKHPHIPLYTGDWMKDTELSLCTPATRGVWIDLICAMHERNRSGELRGTSEQLARLARCSTVELEKALTDLQTTGAAIVDQRNGSWSIANRRMRREAEIRGKRIDAGSKGGIKTASKREQKPDTDNDIECQGILEEFCVSLGLPRSDGASCFHKWEGNGWTNNGQPIRDWRATILSWRDHGYMPSQKMGLKPSTFQKPKEAAPIYAKAQPPLPPLTEQEIERNKKLSAKMVNDLKNKMRP